MLEKGDMGAERLVREGDGYMGAWGTGGRCRINDSGALLVRTADWSGVAGKSKASHIALRCSGRLVALLAAPGKRGT